jgi:hypothetical protein
MTEEERRRRIEDLRERSRETDRLSEEAAIRAEETLALIERALERLRAAR